MVSRHLSHALVKGLFFVVDNYIFQVVAIIWFWRNKESGIFPLKQLLKDRNINKLSHEDIIYKLDKAAETFNVLILKTDFALPYTSIFFELDCGYWNAEKEKALRQSM